MAATVSTKDTATSVSNVTPSSATSTQGEELSSVSASASSTDRGLIRQKIAGEVRSTTTNHNTSVLSLTSDFESVSRRLQGAHAALDSVAHTTSEIRSGHAQMRDGVQAEIQAHERSWSKYNPYSSRFWEGGLIDQKRRDVKASDAFVWGLDVHEQRLRTASAQSQALLGEATTAYQDSQELRREADSALQLARELAARSKEQEARTEAERARELTIRSLERLQEAQKIQQQAVRALPGPSEMGSLPQSATERYRKEISQSSKNLVEIEDSLKQTEGYIRAARNSAIVIGATVATGGLATGSLAATYGVVGAGVISIGGGTAAGTAVGVVLTTAEQGRSVVDGQKGMTQALSEGLSQIGEDAQLALTTSVATYAGMGSLSKVAPKMTTLLGGSRFAATTSNIVSGGLATVPSTILQEGLDVSVKGKEFGGVADLSGKVLKNAVAGGVGTSIGVLGNAARSTNAIRNAAITGGEAVTDAAVSVGVEAVDAALRGKEFSSKQAAAVFNQAIIGTLAGEMSSAAAGRIRSGQRDVSSSGNTDYEHAQQPVQNFTNIPTSRPKPPAPDEIRAYGIGVEAETIPLPAQQKDGKIRIERFIGRQKDTPHETIYYLKSSDYDRVYGAYHNGSPHEPRISDSFFIQDRNISVIRLPDRDSGGSAIGKDGRLMLSPHEKRYLDGLAAHEHSHARGSGEYQAYYEFYRRTDPNARGSNQTGKTAALTPQQINDKVLAHVVELKRTGDIPDGQFERTIQEMKQSVSEDTFLSSLEYIARDGANSAVVDAILDVPSRQDAAEGSRAPSKKAEQRSRRAMNDDRVSLARDVGLDTSSVERQESRVSPLLKRETIRREIADNSPIPLLNSQLQVDRRQYAQVSAIERDRQFTLVDGRVITADLEVRYHSKTQMKDPELPSYRITLEDSRARQYELTDLPVIDHGANPPVGARGYVVLHGDGRATMFVRETGKRNDATKYVPLTRDDAPEMLITADRKVFTRQETFQNKHGSPIRGVANVQGGAIPDQYSDFLKNRWHIPFIPTAMDLVGND